MKLKPSAALARDRAIDVLRGLCIISMTTAHLAAGSWPWQVFHVAVLIDGAVGFVLLSGVVLGMTQHRTVERAGLPTGRRRLLRRAGLIYAANIGLSLLALAVAAGDSDRTAEIFRVASLDAPLPLAVDALTLRINPHYTSILSLYVVLLLLSIVAVSALAHHQPQAVVAGSFALYIAGYLFPAVFTFPLYPGIAGAVNWATWQPLFMAGLLAGWYWQAPAIRAALASRALLVNCGVLMLATAALGWVITRGAAAPWKSALAQAFTEGKLAPGTIVMGLAAVLVGYRACRVFVRAAYPVLSPVARIGRHSLDCYLILSVAVLVLPILYTYPADGIVAVGVSFQILLLMFGWSLLRDWLAQRSNALPSSSTRRSPWRR
ncbi:MAG: OpgC domain-containing protein [Nakamurella sp.]